jgi:hypothetical protein
MVALLRDRRERGRDTVDIFTEIYRSKVGGSGSGTTSDPLIAAPYINCAREFIMTRPIETVDLGAVMRASAGRSSIDWTSTMSAWTSWRQ